MISSLVSPEHQLDPFAPKPLIEECTIGSMQNKIKYNGLIDTGALGYAFIDIHLAQQLMELFNIATVPLSKPKPIRAYDGVYRPPITDKLYLTLTIRKKTVCSAPFLITTLRAYSIIIGYPWMKAVTAFIDCAAGRVRYLPDRYTWPKDSSTPLLLLKELPLPKKVGMLSGS